MYGQLNATQGTRKYRPNYLADLNSRLSFLPQQMAMESQEKFQGAQIKNMEETNKINQARLGLEQSNLDLSNKRFGLDEQQFGLQKKSASFQQRATEKGMDLKERQEGMSAGVGAAGLGFNILGSKWGGATVGQLTDKLGSSTGWWKPSEGGGAPSGGGSFWNDMPVGASVAGGLAGFGASKFLPTENKFLKAGIGAGVGGLVGLLGSGSGSGGMGAFGGGLLGGLGGLF